MYRSNYVRVLALVALFVSASSVGRVPAQTKQSRDYSQSATNTTVHLRRRQRTGISRYRLQLARDRDFADIVFDRGVTGNEHEINDLAPGRYFWRIAPLTTKLGEFSSAAAIEVNKPAREVIAIPQSVPTTPDPNKKAGSAISIVVGGGWRAAVGDVSRPVLAHLRSTD